MLTTYIIGAFILLSIVISALFFYISSRENDEFIMYWGLSWIFYSLALLCLLASINYEVRAFVEIKKVFDMYSIQCLLFGIYKFCRMKVPGYWLRFSIYLTVWVMITIYLGLDILSASMPIFLFDLLMTGIICYVIVRYWMQRTYEKLFYCVVFILWGVVKAGLAIYETGYFELPAIYIGEILYANLLNVCIFIIYLRHIKLEMARTEERFKIIVENAIDTIFYFTFIPIPAFLYITPSIEAMSGYGSQVFYKDPKAMLEMVRKEDFEMINRVFFSGPESTAPTSEVFKIKRKDGAEIWVNMSVSLIKKGDETIAIEGVIRDITQMKEVQDDLTTSKQSRDLLLSYISHELKTPITSILGYVTAIKDGTISEDEERKKAMEIISQKSLVLERMILDLFQLSQLETNQYSFAYKHMDCLETANEMHEHILPELRESGIAHMFIIEKDKLAGLNVIVDPVRMNQVLTNLVINAIKYTRDKNHITVKYTVDDKRENMIVSVADSGRGIAKEDLPHVFERFFKSENTEMVNSQGRGLGLALSKEIVEAHGGSIEVRSKQGKGSIFTISIPLYKEE